MVVANNLGCSVTIDAKETKNLGRISLSGKASIFSTTEAKLGTPLAEAELLKAGLPAAAGRTARLQLNAPKILIFYERELKAEKHMTLLD